VVPFKWKEKKIDPYTRHQHVFFNPGEIKDLLLKELKPKIKSAVHEIHFYGTGLFRSGQQENNGQGS
jgi:hypothetical protein